MASWPIPRWAHDVIYVWKNAQKNVYSLKSKRLNRFHKTTKGNIIESTVKISLRI